MEGHTLPSLLANVSIGILWVINGDFAALRALSSIDCRFGSDEGDKRTSSGSRGRAQDHVPSRPNPARLAFTLRAALARFKVRSEMPNISALFRSSSADFGPSASCSRYQSIASNFDERSAWCPWSGGASRSAAVMCVTSPCQTIADVTTGLLSGPTWRSSNLNFSVGASRA
jgi:hypothetical protein